MKYRPEIDGLRAFALLPVILFHAGFEWFSGGFVGVDVFFVISGYLIATIIISEMTEGKFSLINFYERRARRILPALFFVMAACLPFAWLWLVPNDLKDFGQSLAAVSIFSSNILFWLESGYFETATELKPLLHTWSLAVEEQYYILFPIFLMFFWKLGVRWVLILLSIVFLISLGISHWASSNSPSANFYLLPTRGWELLVGVFAAFYLNYNTHFKSHILNQALSLLGFGMIVYSIMAFDKKTPLPSLYTLIPTIGTGLLILSAVPKTLIHNLLGLKPFVGVGLISYSAYLWHQPLLAFTRHRIFFEASDFLLIFICLSSLLLAYLSWRFIEAPFRNKQAFTQNKIFMLSATGIVIFSVLGLFLQLEPLLGKAPGKLQNIQYQSLANKVLLEGEVCSDEDITHQQTFSFCTLGDKDSDKSLVFYGDSHLQALQYSLDHKLRMANLKGIWLRNVLTCETTIFTTIRNNISLNKLECPANYVEALDYFADADYLVLVSRWSMKYFFPSSEINHPHFINKSLGCEEKDLPYRDYMPMDNYGFKDPSAESMAEALVNLLEASSSKLTTVVVYPVPEVGCDPYKYNVHHKNITGFELETLSFPVEEYDRRNEFVISTLDEFYEQNRAAVIPVRLRSAFCHRHGIEGCLVVENSAPLYFDDDHLSDAGADIVVKEIFKVLELGN
jgi:peptidoglycan/LPS O-acetylase OafA/YrhL